jgi:hypothetical protein
MYVSSTYAPPHVGRRGFLRIAARIGVGVVAAGIGSFATPAWLAAANRAAPRGAPFSHPEPRPDVDGSLVLSADAVLPHVGELFDGLRAIPHLADGIGCHCGCGAMPDMRSLLSCYEGIGMAQFCVICEGEGRLAVRLHAEGRSLDEIRAAIDRRYG